MDTNQNFILSLQGEFWKYNYIIFNNYLIQLSHLFFYSVEKEVMLKLFIFFKSSMIYLYV